MNIDANLPYSYPIHSRGSCFSRTIYPELRALQVNASSSTFTCLPNLSADCHLPIHRTHDHEQPAGILLRRAHPTVTFSPFGAGAGVSTYNEIDLHGTAGANGGRIRITAPLPRLRSSVP